MSKSPEHKLIYVNKIGRNSKGEGLYEFIFSEDPDNIKAEEWGWDTSPASSNAEPPTDDCISKILNLRTNLFELICLHESNDRPYSHGCHTIQALAYENDDVDTVDPEYKDMYEDAPLLVFHYGMSVESVKDLLYERDVVLKGDDFVASKAKTKVTKAEKKQQSEDEDDDGKEESKDDFFQIKF